LQQILTVTATLKKKRDISIRISCKKILQQQDQIHSPNKALQYQKKKEIIATLQIILETSDGTPKHQERTIATR